MATRKLFNVEKLVDPLGNILNDSDSGIDYLDHTIYAQALSRKIEHVHTPITIGIFGRWGSGKSFLLNYVKNLLSRRQRQSEVEIVPSSKSRNFSYAVCGLRTIALIVFISLIVVSSLWAASPHLFMPPTFPNSSLVEYDDVNMTSSANGGSAAVTSEFWMRFSQYLALAILIFCLVVVCVVICGNNDWWSSEFFSNFRLILYVAFTKLPVKKIKKSFVKEPSEYGVIHEMDVEASQKDECNCNFKRYIFVNFNAWEYAGSDILWAGIVTNLSNAIEAEFGSVTSRLFRMLSVVQTTCDVGRGDVNTPLFVNLPTLAGKKKKMREMMMEYGVVRTCEKYSDWKRESLKESTSKECEGWWVVEYSNFNETKNATMCLGVSGVEITYNDPGLQEDLNEETPLNSYDHCDAAPGRCHDLKKTYITQDKPQHDGIATPSIGSSFVTEKKGRTRHAKNRFMKHFMKHPKTICKFPILYWWILIFFAVLSIPVITYVVAESLDLEVFRTPRVVPVVVQVFSWLPAVGAASFVMLKFGWAMLHSQRSRIHSALEGTAGNMAAQLGFMDKVKTEVQFITKLIRCAKFSHDKQYKVVVTIDDLDRISLEKIRSVLEAVSILLSDRCSPFICLIAVDSRVAVKSIEENMGSTLLKTSVNGHEYLKKIINLPFCLPQVENRRKKNFIDGLIDMSDKTTKQRVIPFTQTNGDKTDSNSPFMPNNRSIDEIDGAAGKKTDMNKNGGSWFRKTRCDSSKPITSTDGQDDLDGNRKEVRRPSIPKIRPFSEKLLDKEQFLFECRKFFYTSVMVQRHLEGNPRNIKRIFNVISLTACVINCYEEQVEKELFFKTSSNLMGRSQTGVKVTSEDFAGIVRNPENRGVRNLSLVQDLVIWIVLTDQWPYRVTYLLQVIEDCDFGSTADCFPDSTALLDIYKKYVELELKVRRPEDEDQGLHSLDSNPDVFCSFLTDLLEEGNYLNKGRVKALKPYTINLDHSLRQNVVFHRSLAAEKIDAETQPAQYWSRTSLYDEDTVGGASITNESTWRPGCGDKTHEDMGNERPHSQTEKLSLPLRGSVLMDQDHPM